MILPTEMTDIHAPKDLVTPKPLGARMSCYGNEVGWRRLNNVVTSRKMSFKFVLNAVSPGPRKVENVLMPVGFEIELNFAKTTLNAPNLTRLIGLGSAVSRWWKMTAPKPIVVNPMLTESA